MPTETDLSLEEMINQGPSWLSEYLCTYEEGRPNPTENVFLGIFAGASSMAFSTNSVEWVAIAVRSGQLRATHDLEHRHDALQASMSLRVEFIKRFGPVSGDPVLDPQGILTWFKAENRLTIEEVRAKAAKWADGGTPIAHRLPLDDLQELRRLKNRLGVLQRLDETRAAIIDADLIGWLELLPTLP